MCSFSTSTFSMFEDGKLLFTEFIEALTFGKAPWPVVSCPPTDRFLGIGISNTLFHDFAMYRSLPEGASAKKFLPPRCFTKFSPLKECDVLPADTDTRASGRAGSPALAKVHPVKDQAAWNRSTRRARERGGARAGRPRCVRMLTMTAGSSMAAMILRRAPQCEQCSMSISKTRLSKRDQLMRASAPGACCAA